MPKSVKRTSRGRYVPFVRSGVRFVSNMAGRYLRNKAVNYLSGRKKGSVDGIGVTDQYDRKLIYRKKRMPRRMRKRWRKKKRGFDAMLMKRLATKTIVFNDTLTTGDWVGSDQRNVLIHLYGKNGTDRAALEQGTHDVYDVLNNDPLTNETIEKAVFESAVLDFTCANTGQSTLEVDVYEFYSGGLRNHVTPNWGTDQASAQVDVPSPGGGPWNMNLDNRGVSPFEFPLMGRYGWKILKKTKFLLSPGKSFTYQHRDPKNRWISGSDVFKSTAGTDVAMKGATRSFLFLAKQQVGGGDLTNRLSVGATRVFRYKVMESNRIESENLF